MVAVNPVPEKASLRAEFTFSRDVMAFCA